MILQMVRKDLLLVKKYVLLSLVFSIFVPIYIYMGEGNAWGLPGLVLTTVFSLFMLFQSLSAIEEKYPKAEALLCALPLSRRSLVLARYLFVLLGFAVSIGLYTLVYLLMSGSTLLPLSDYLLTFFVAILLFGVYIPLQYKFGFTKTRYIMLIVVFATPFTIGYMFRDDKAANWLAALPPWMITLLPLLLGACILLLGTSKNNKTTEQTVK